MKSTKKWNDRKLLANRIILLLVIGVGLIMCFTTSCTPTDYYGRCLPKCVDYYGKIPYRDQEEWWRTLVDLEETTLNFEEWKKGVHAKRNHYAEYTYCPKACRDTDIYMRMGWY